MKIRTLIIPIFAVLSLAACKKDKVYVSGVSLNKPTLSLPVGLSEQLVATITPSYADNKYVAWFSDNTTVVNVDNGLVIGVTAGTANVTVTTSDGGYTATCVVTVTDELVSVTGVTLDHNTLDMYPYDLRTLKATILPANATNQNVSWKSSNELVASVESSLTVSGGANIVALAPGTTTITVTTEDGSKTASCVVTVSPKSGPSAVK